MQNRQNIPKNCKQGKLFEMFSVTKILFVKIRYSEWKQTKKICENNQAEIFLHFNNGKIKLGTFFLAVFAEPISTASPLLRILSHLKIFRFTHRGETVDGVNNDKFINHET